jgi:chemotaxis protein CheX
VDTPDDFRDAFTAAVEMALRELAGVEVVRRGTSRAVGGDGLDEVSVVLRLDGEAVRWAILSFPAGTAAAVARRVLAEIAGEPDDGMIRDCVAEVLNVIAGQAKALLFGTPHHFLLSTPTALAAASIDLSEERAAVRFDSEAGGFTLHLCPPLVARGGGPSVTGKGVE